MLFKSSVIKTHFLSWTFLLFILSHAHAQLEASGKEFWLGFMDNYRIEPNAEFPNGLIDHGLLEIIAVDDAQGNIRFAGRNVPFTLREGERFSYTIPDDADIIHRGSGTTENKGVHITADGNIMVYAYNHRQNSTDGTAILPLSSLTDDYWVMAHFNNFGPDVFQYDGTTEAAASFLVVATEDNTVVEINPRSTTLDGRSGVTSYQVTLNAGQTHQVQSKNLLTSSWVRVIQENGTCKRIAVFGGNRWGNQGGLGPDNSHLYTQMLPNSEISQDFMYVPTQSSIGRDLLGFFSPALEGFVTSYGETSPNPLGLGVLGGVMQWGPTSVHMSEAGFAYLVTSSLAVYSDHIPTGGIGDPAMTYLKGLDKMITRSVISVRDFPSISEHKLILIVETANNQTLRINGSLYQEPFSVFSDNAAYQYIHLPLADGVYTIENPGGFIGYQIGFGFNESYAITLHQAENAPEFDKQSTYGFEVTGNTAACLRQEGSWTITPEDEDYLFFTWDFGDGTSPTNGSTVTHTYEEPGTYEILVLAKMTEDECEIPGQTRLEVTVEDNTGEINGPNNVCPEVEELDYFFIPSEVVSRVEWESVGGEILEELPDFGVKIRWGVANEQAAIRAVAFTAEGCPSDTVVLDVRIRQVLEPGPPIGSDILCIAEEELYVYAVAEELPGRGYEWQVSGGEIIGSENSPEVSVRWNLGEGAGEIGYKEFSLDDEYCEGLSDRLQVALYGNLLVLADHIDPARCQGESSGAIQLQVLGGSGDYTYVWDHDAELNSPRAENLAAGSYSVTVEDVSGCIGHLEGIIVTEPEALAVDGEISLFQVSCFGQDDGEAVMAVTGGTLPYHIDADHADISSGQLSLSHLASGTHRYNISDANGCSLEIVFSLETPEPLEVMVSVETQACPGQSNGSLMATPVGGVPPFTYQWHETDANTEFLSEVPTGVYTVTVTDANGCMGTGQGILGERDPELRMPSGFRPDPTNFSARYQGVSNCPIDFELKIFNRWGELIFVGSQGWDGQVNGTPAPVGSYTYLIQYSYWVNGESINRQKRGGFTLVN